VLVLHKSAKLSACRNYRYALWRSWDDSKPRVMFIGLNPSTADEAQDDPTLRRCMNYAQDWGFGSVCISNLFAFRATEPNDMKNAENPIGSENDKWLMKLVGQSSLIVAAWGNDGSFLDRSAQVRKFLPELHCLKLNKSGEPAHPLYQKAKLNPIAFA
jgi:hypothetical protein